MGLFGNFAVPLSVMGFGGTSSVAVSGPDGTGTLEAWRIAVCPALFCLFAPNVVALMDCPLWSVKDVEDVMPSMCSISKL